MLILLKKKRRRLQYERTIGPRKIERRSRSTRKGHNSSRPMLLPCIGKTSSSLREVVTAHGVERFSPCPFWPLGDRLASTRYPSWGQLLGPSRDRRGHFRMVESLRLADLFGWRTSSVGEPLRLADLFAYIWMRDTAANDRQSHISPTINYRQEIPCCSDVIVVFCQTKHRIPNSKCIF